MKFFILLCFCTLFIKSFARNKNCGNFKLELVQVLLRHGARTPIRSAYDVFNYTDASEYEPWGLEGLNNFGKEQQYTFGRFLRKRYANYLSSTYKSEDVYSYTSDTYRTKMSLELVLAGLYPPVCRTRWNDFLNWSPIPYTYTPMELDILLSSFRSDKYTTLLRQILTSDEFKNKSASYTEFFQFVAENIRSDNASLTTTVMTFDVLISNEYMNLPLPKWYTLKVKQTFIEVMELVWDAWAATTELKKVGTGALIKTFVDNMNSTDNSRKIHLYQGHDANIAIFTRSHNIREFRYPFFGSALIVEKLRDSANQLYVRIFAWDGLGNLTPLKIGENGECCPINDYLEIVKPIIPSEVELNDMVGNFNSTKIRDIFFNSSEKGTENVKNLLN